MNEVQEPAPVAAHFERDGFAIIPGVYSTVEVNHIVHQIDIAAGDGQQFRRQQDLYAIRRFLQTVPAVAELVFNQSLKTIIAGIRPQGCFVVKSIYFDKPPGSNWYVANHQDLTIPVDQQMRLPGFVHWTKKQDQFAVQPPLEFLENMYTIRIHLDDTDEANGALHVVAGSHQHGVVQTPAIPANNDTVCAVPMGGIMLMTPLLLHRSGRTTNGQRRRVIHIEFANMELPEGLQWSERQSFTSITKNAMR